MPTVHGRPLPGHVYARLVDSGISADMVAEICMAVEDGVSGLKDFFGISPAVLDAIEAAALGFYRQGLFMYASLQYTFVVDLDGERATGWRGLGATLLALGRHERALMALTTSCLLAPDDGVARFLLGEALVAARQGPAAKKTLERALQMAGSRPELATYARRARAILGAQDLGALASPPGDRLPTPEEAADMTLADLDRHPAGRALLDRLWRGLQRNALTLKDVAGMTDEQMVGAYNAACGLLEGRQPIPALRVAGWLLYYDGRNPLYYRLAGVASQQMQLWCLADYMFDLALIYAPGDPICQIYQGEVKVFSNETAAGLALIRGALPKLGRGAFEEALAARARGILKFHQATTAAT